MWVFCCGMYRSASTLQFQITSRLVKEADLGQQVGWIDAKRFAQVRAAYADQSGLKVVKVHLCTDAIAAEFSCDNAIGIYSFRDVRDVYASSMKQRIKPFAYLWDEGFLDFCLENYRRWTQLPNMLISRYETIISHLPEEVQRIAAHLGIELSYKQCQAIAADYAIELQQERIKQFRNKLLQTEHNPDDHREIVDYHDEESLLHLNHIDSGKTGRWQTDLNSQEVALIVDRVQSWCTANQYPASLFLRAEQV